MPDNLANGDLAMRADNAVATTGGVAGVNKLWLN